MSPYEASRRELVDAYEGDIRLCGLDVTAAQAACRTGLAITNVLRVLVPMHYAAGQSSRTAAVALGVSSRTVDRHIARARFYGELPRRPRIPHESYRRKAA